MCLPAVLVAASATTAFANPRVYVNGKRISGDVIMSDGTIYVPLRSVGESLGAKVLWDSDTSAAFVSLSEDDALAKLVSDVSPSVVAIIGNYSGTGETIGFNNPTVHGTGVIYRSDGRIITNAHVVKDTRNLTVVLSDGTALPGSVMYSDETADLAIVKVNAIGLKPIVFADKSSIESGRTAIAIGTPISLSMRNTVTKGIVCGCDVSLSDSHYKLIQTDATVNPGNSGGALLNINGELIGINSSKYAGTGIDNMAFAIPADTVEYAISEFETYGLIRRPKTGITLEQSWEAKIGLPTTKGITVKTSENSILQKGDVITAVNGIAVHSIADWNEALRQTYNGSSVNVKYTSNGTEKEVVIQG